MFQGSLIRSAVLDKSWKMEQTWRQHSPCISWGWPKTDNGRDPRLQEQKQTLPGGHLQPAEDQRSEHPGGEAGHHPRHVPRHHHLLHRRHLVHGEHMFRCSNLSLMAYELGCSASRHHVRGGQGQGGPAGGGARYARRAHGAILVSGERANKMTYLTAH